MTSGTLNRLTAFTDNPNGGNPAGVWVGDTLPEPATMQRIAAEVGFSETAFVAPSAGSHRQVRFFSPEAEVAFCGHATIATGVLLGEQNGEDTYLLNTRVGEIPVAVHASNGIMQASLTSVEPSFVNIANDRLEEVLSALNWQRQELDDSIPPAIVYSGNRHLILAVKSKARLDNLDYDFERLKSIMLVDELTTLQLVWQQSPGLFHSRNPFPVGGIIEDPATGSAAAALGGYLREAKLIRTPNNLEIRQGEAMGRPSRIQVDIPLTGGIKVSGTALKI